MGFPEPHPLLELSLDAKPPKPHPPPNLPLDGLEAGGISSLFTPSLLPSFPPSLLPSFPSGGPYQPERRSRVVDNSTATAPASAVTATARLFLETNCHRTWDEDTRYHRGHAPHCVGAPTRCHAQSTLCLCPGILCTAFDPGRRRRQRRGPARNRSSDLRRERFGHRSLQHSESRRPLGTAVALRRRRRPAAGCARRHSGNDHHPHADACSGRRLRR